jgi:hypothetical protein
MEKKSITITERVYSVITILIRISLVIAIGYAFYTEDYFVFLFSIVTLVLTFVPWAFEKSLKIDVPIEFEVAAVIFVYATIFLGEATGLYTYFWWWDLLLHSFSALVFGMIGFVILFFLDKNTKIDAPPIWLAVFTFTFAIAIGSLWEIFEFTADQFLGTNMQKSGLMDTMTDLIVDTFGALIASLLGYFYLKGRKFRPIDKMIKTFIKDNPSLFKK